ncbi:MAG TPA: hypothetical protein VNG90_02345 [Candidatus Acidoferrum sp.]|nr:hypothetical protein [Candidatus Acidoferrum sp.]
MRVKVDHSGIFANAVMRAVEATEKQHGIHLLFGSMSSRQEPGYNFGVDIAVFHNLTEQQAGTVKGILVENGVPDKLITVW